MCSFNLHGERSEHRWSHPQHYSSYDVAEIIEMYKKVNDFLEKKTPRVEGIKSDQMEISSRKEQNAFLEHAVLNESLAFLFLVQFLDAELIRVSGFII